jgi:hypothetical protein
MSRTLRWAGQDVRGVLEGIAERAVLVVEIPFQRMATNRRE